MIVPVAQIHLRRDEDGIWIAKSKLLPGCHAHGNNRREALLRFQEAAKAHSKALLENGRPILAPFRDKFNAFSSPPRLTRRRRQVICST
jgi:predicted RNase H-like HicB family nuclease